MLRRQYIPPDSMSVLAGDSELALRIREYDWAVDPFGRVESWPQSLKSALGICLNSAFPTAIYWGSEPRLLYNDAWESIAGPRHPAALGVPAQEVWSDNWHVIEPQFTHLIGTGEEIFVAVEGWLVHRHVGDLAMAMLAVFAFGGIVLTPMYARAWTVPQFLALAPVFLRASEPWEQEAEMWGKDCDELDVPAER